MSGGKASPESGDVVTLIYVPGQSGAIQRFNVSRRWIRRVSAGAIALAVALLVLSVDYVRARRQLTELDYLRTETSEQREQLLAYSSQVEEITEHLARISQFDRKLRVITNLDPADPLPLPGIGGVEEDLLSAEGLTREGRHRRMTRSFERLSEAANTEALSLQSLVQHLENQQARLAATPSVVPTRGWVTSSFGYRASPFTGNREFHHGIDIAGRMGTPILAPADGVVRFAGKRRALGNTVSLTHGYGVQTIYGHLAEIEVKSGDKVHRGQVIAKMGNTGRSTGPHLHYQVEVSGKPVNPYNYMLD